MNRIPLTIVLSMAAVCLLATASFAQVPRSNHVYILAEENISYEHEVGDTTDMPYLNSLISQGGLATQFYSNQHSSLPNYFWVTAGQYITDNNDTTATYDVDNIVRHVLASGKTFRSYAQTLPYAGFTGLYSGEYLKRHAPLIYYTDVAGSASMILNHVDTNVMAEDIASGNLPNFAFITPDAAHDIHDCPNGLNVCMQTADLWLKQNIGPLLARPEFQPGGDGLLIIWADEADLYTDSRCSSTVSTGCGGRILVALIGPNVKHGYQSTTTYHHENVLRTMMEALGTTSNFPGAAETAADMAEFFQSSGPAPTPVTRKVTIQAPLAGASIGSPVQIAANAVSDATISAITAYVDNVGVNTVYSNQMNASVAVSPGTHNLVVNAWDVHGNLMQSSSQFTALAPAYGVNVNSPNDGGTTDTSMRVAASATASAPITTITVYVDGAAAITGYGSSIDTYIPLPAGIHHVTITAWDTTGKSYSKTVSVTAASSTASGVTIAAPAANALTGNAVRLQATAQSNLPITAMTVYVDGHSVYTNHGAVDTNIALTTGTHTLGVNAWDTSGAVFMKNITVTASASAADQVSIALPANAAAGTAVNILVYASSNVLVKTTALYIDSVLTWMGTSNVLNVTGIIPAGTHSVVAQAWDANGGIYKTAASITVK